MPIGQFEDDTPRDDASANDHSLDEYCSKMSRAYEADFHVLLSQILEAQRQCSFFCVEFESDAELFFQSDSEDFIHSTLRKREAEEWSDGQIVEGWSEMAVFRNGIFQQKPPTPLQQIYADHRLRMIDSLQTLLTITDACGGSEKDAYLAADFVFKNKNIDDMPSADFLSFLDDCLRMGGNMKIAGSANIFLQQALRGQQAQEYRKFFDTHTQNHLKKERKIRFDRAVFAQHTGVYLPSIRRLRELNEAVDSASKEHREELLNIYLDALDDSTTPDVITGVVVQLMQSSNFPTVRKTAQSTLKELGWTWRDSQWINIKHQSGSCQRNPTSV